MISIIVNSWQVVMELVADFAGERDVVRVEVVGDLVFLNISEGKK